MNDNTVNDLREKTEEMDLNTILKPSMGGYTKKSVMEYLAYLKKQQQDSRDTGLENLSRLKSEKDSLQQENSELQADLDEAIERIHANEAELEQCRAALARCQAELEEERKKAAAAEESAAGFRSLLDEVNERNEELNQAIAELDELPVHQPSVSARESVKLPADNREETEAQLRALLDSSEALQTEMTARAAAMTQQVHALEALTREQMQNSRAAMEQLQAELQSSADQNELLESEKDGLTRRVSELQEQNLTLGRENSRLKAANLILQRRMEGR